MATDTQIAPASTKMLWTGRIISALPVLFMLFGAVFSFAKPEAVAKDFSKYGYPESSLQRLIIVEMVCVVIYVIPATAVLGAILLTGYLGGATATHVRIGESFFLPVIMGVIVWLGLFFRDPRLRALIPFRRSPG